MPKIKLFNCFEVKNETATSADLYFYGDIVSDYGARGRKKINIQKRSKIS